MTIRLNKVTRDLNVGITTAVEFLQKKGFTVEANPNTKITDEQFELLKKEFSTDKDLKIKSERFSQERQSKDRNKASVSIDGYKETQEKAKPEEIKTVVPEDAAVSKELSLSTKYVKAKAISDTTPGKISMKI